MLGKLLKYDLKWTLKNIFIFLGLGLFLAIVGRLLEFGPNSLFFEILIAILKGAGLSLSISGLVNAVIRSWVRFVLNLYKDESYLTNTLPVSRNTLYLSKILNAIICILICFISLFACIMIMYYNENTIEWIKNSFNLVSSSMNMSVFSFILVILLVCFIEIVFITLSGYFGIIFGYSRNTKKGLYSFIYGIGVYFLCTIVTLIILIITSLFNDGLHGIVFGGNSFVEFSLLKAMLLFALGIYVIYSLILYFISNVRYNKGINIE